LPPGFIGLIVGALPGLTTTMGIALLTGINFKFSGHSAIALLMGLYVAVSPGGSLAILIGIPARRPTPHPPWTVSRSPWPARRPKPSRFQRMASSSARFWHRLPGLLDAAIDGTGLEIHFRRDSSWSGFSAS
jgi:hypothetical protein